MTSQEGIVWCWKVNVENTLFIFRDSYQEIEINLNHIKNPDWFLVNNKCLLPIEKEFLKNIVTKTL